MLARIELLRLLDQASIEADFIGTIHDSLVVDCPTENVPQVATMIRQAIESVPSLCKKIWNYDFSLPITCEILVGPNKADMVEFA